MDQILSRGIVVCQINCAGPCPVRLFFGRIPNEIILTVCFAPCGQIYLIAIVYICYDEAHGAVIRGDLCRDMSQ